MQPDGAKGTTGASRRWPRRGVDLAGDRGVDLAGVYLAGVSGHHTMTDEERDLWLMTLFFKNRGMDLHVLNNIAMFADRMDWGDLLISLLLE